MKNIILVFFVVLFSSSISNAQDYRLQNFWTGTYLNNQEGNVDCTTIQPGWHSAMWSLKAL